MKEKYLKMMEVLIEVHLACVNDVVDLDTGLLVFGGRRIASEPPSWAKIYLTLKNYGMEGAFRKTTTTQLRSGVVSAWFRHDKVDPSCKAFFKLQISNKLKNGAVEILLTAPETSCR